MPRRQRLIDRREELGLSQDDVARAAGLTDNTIRRYELGLSTPRGGDRRAYAEALGWEPLQLALAIADEPQPVNGHAVPEWLGHLASLEQAAGRLCAFESVGVHGLLQTPEYAGAVEQAEGTRSPEAVARRVEKRLARQAALGRQPDPLVLDVTLDESVLHRMAGGAPTMAAQLDHLVDIAGRPNVTVRVLPLDAGLFPFGSFTLFTQPGAVAPYMAVTEDRAGPHYIDRSHDLEAHSALYTHLTSAALDIDESVERITAAAKEYRQ